MKFDDDKADGRISKLIWKWEESVLGGDPISIDRLCADCPELADSVYVEIQRLQNFDRFLGLAPEIDSITGGNSDSQTQTIFPLPELAGFEILEEIGRGGMGVVYKARQHNLGRIVAIKTLAKNRSAMPESVSRLMREAKALSLVNDPHVVKVFDVVETQDTVLLVLEYVDGENLSRRLSGVPLSARESAEYALTLARSIQKVHQLALLHRDIKPANILIATTGELKIADFGLAKQVGTADGLTMTGELFGSPSYMAPEQAEGCDHNIDVRTDVYGLGATLYQMITGRPPFVGSSTVQTLDLVRRCEPIRPQLLNPLVPTDLETICLKCLEKDPAQRFESAEELAEELARFLDGLPIRSRQIAIIDRCWRWCKRRPAVAGLMTIALVAMVANIGIIFNNQSTHQRNLTLYSKRLSKLNEQLRMSANAARRSQIEAEVSERNAKDLLYASDISRAALAWRREDTREMIALLERQIPRPGEPDRRGFEWWYLNRQAIMAKQLILQSGKANYVLQFTPDRRFIATAGEGAIVRLIDADTHRIKQQIFTDQIEINGIAFAPDQPEIATTGDDGTLRVTNLQTGALRLKIETPFVKAYQVLYTPNGETIVCCGNHPTIYVFDSRTGHVVRTLEGHKDKLENIALGTDGKTLVSAGDDIVGCVWDLDDGTLQSTFMTTANVEPMIFLQSRGLLITGDTKGLLRTIRIIDGVEISSAKNLDRIVSLALHPAGSLLAVGDLNGKIRLRRLGSAGELYDDDLQPWQAHQNVVYALAWSTDGTRLLSTGNDGRVQSWSLFGIQRPEIEKFTLEQSQGQRQLPSRTSVTTIEIQRTIRRARTSRSEMALGHLVRWNLQDARAQNRSLGDHYVEFRESPDGHYLAAASNQAGDEIVEVFRIPDDDITPIDQHLIGKAHGRLMESVFSKDSQSIVIVHDVVRNGESAESEFTLYRLPDFDKINFPVVHDTRTVIPLIDEQRAFCATTSDVILWNTAHQRTKWKVPMLSVSQMCYCNRNQVIAVATSNRSVTVLDADSGEIRFQLLNLAGQIQHMLFSEDGKTLVTVTDDGTLKLTHVVTGQELLEFPKLGPVIHTEFVDQRHLVCGIRSYSADNCYDPSEIVLFDASDPTFEGKIGNSAAVIESH